MIILDSCSVILLAKASVLEIFIETHKAGITKDVFDEVIKGKVHMFQDALLVERLNDEKKINIIDTDLTLTRKMVKDFNMGLGEASTIAAAKKQDIVATDNLQGRKAAVVRNLSLVGSPEIVVNLFKIKKINKTKATEALQMLRKEGWFNSYIIEKAMEDTEKS